MYVCVERYRLYRSKQIKYVIHANTDKKNQHLIPTVYGIHKKGRHPITLDWWWVSKIVPMTCILCWTCRVQFASQPIYIVKYEWCKYTHKKNEDEQKMFYVTIAGQNLCGVHYHEWLFLEFSVCFFVVGRIFLFPSLSRRIRCVVEYQSSFLCSSSIVYSMVLFVS